MSKHSKYDTSVQEEVGSGLGSLYGIGTNVHGSTARTLGAGVVGGLIGRSLFTKEKGAPSKARHGLATSGAVLGGVHGILTGRNPASSVLKGIGQAYIGGLAGDGLGIHVDRLNKMAELDKQAFEVSDQVKKDAVSLGLIASIGGLGNLASTKLLKPGASGLKVFAAGTGLGLVGDYVGMKMGNAYSKHVDGQVKNKYITKMASTALSRRLNDGKTPNLSVSHTNELFNSSGAANKAMDKARATGANTAEIVRRQGQASTQSAKQISSANLNKLVGSPGSDPLNISIQDRLAAKRKSMNLPDPNGNKAVQIRNANAMRTSSSTSSTFKAGPGMSGLSNASKVNDALLAARDGRKAHLNLDMKTKTVGVDTVAKKVVPEIAPTGLLHRAKQLMKHPLAKKVGIGAGLVGLGAAAATAMSNKTAEPTYTY